MTCPFSECKASQIDAIKTTAKQERHSRHTKILELSAKGVHPKIITDKVGYKNVGDVYRVIRENKKH